MLQCTSASNFPLKYWKILPLSCFESKIFICDSQTKPFDCLRFIADSTHFCLWNYLTKENKTLCYIEIICSKSTPEICVWENMWNDGYLCTSLPKAPIFFHWGRETKMDSLTQSLNGEIVFYLQSTMAVTFVRVIQRLYTNFFQLKRM